MQSQWRNKKLHLELYGYGKNMWQCQVELPQIFCAQIFCAIVDGGTIFGTGGNQKEGGQPTLFRKEVPSADREALGREERVAMTATHPLPSALSNCLCA